MQPGKKEWRGYSGGEVLREGRGDGGGWSEGRRVEECLEERVERRFRRRQVRGGGRGEGRRVDECQEERVEGGGEVKSRVRSKGGVMKRGGGLKEVEGKCMEEREERRCSRGGEGRKQRRGVWKREKRRRMRRMGCVQKRKEDEGRCVEKGERRSRRGERAELKVVLG